LVGWEKVASVGAVVDDCKCSVLCWWFGGRRRGCLYRVERVCEEEWKLGSDGGVVMMGIMEEIIFIWRLIGSKCLFFPSKFPLL
jgi:hypothetical protein